MLAHNLMLPTALVGCNASLGRLTDYGGREAPPNESIHCSPTSSY
jgi:hypothetical protein